MVSDMVELGELALSPVGVGLKNSVNLEDQMPPLVWRSGHWIEMFPQLMNRLHVFYCFLVGAQHG